MKRRLRIEQLNSENVQLNKAPMTNLLGLVIMIICIQGGALNRGLFFADPPPSLLGAVSGKISKIR